MNMNSHKIIDLFPTPLYIDKIDNPLINQQKTYLLNLPRNENNGNTRSENSYIFEHPLFANLKQTINEHIKEFVNMLYPNSNTDVYITQSWVNYTETNQFHHKHTHPNSFISGVFYVNAVKDEDMINFYKLIPFNYELHHEEHNKYNSSHVSIFVESGDLVLFPSTFTHDVPPTTSKETRISISFNTFIKGNIGDEVAATALYLK
jgi:uncharacterized protein (TIGR02466 family)